MDLRRFTTLVRDGLARIRDDHIDQAVALLMEADELYEEPVEWSTPTADDLELGSLRREVLRALVGAAVAKQDHDAAIRYRFRLSDADGSDPFYGLARTAAAARRHGEARRYYRIYRTRSEKPKADLAPFPGPGRT